MAFFNMVLVKDAKTGKLINIQDLDRNRYEEFLDVMQKISLFHSVVNNKPEQSKSNNDTVNESNMTCCCQDPEHGFKNNNCPIHGIDIDDSFWKLLD